jgi:hypothetical protein
MRSAKACLQPHRRWSWTGVLDVPCALRLMIDSAPRTGNFLCLVDVLSPVDSASGTGEFFCSVDALEPMVAVCVRVLTSFKFVC